MSAKRPLTDDEIEAMLQHGFTGEYRLRNRAMFALGIATGYRMQEILYHRVGDVVARSRVLDHIELPRKFRKGKTSGQTKTLFPFAKRALQEHVDDMATRLDLSDDYTSLHPHWLFESQKVNPRTGEYDQLSYSWAWQIMQNAFDRCDIAGAVSTHSMRKTYAEKVYDQALERYKTGQSDVPPTWVVQQALGHTNPSNTLKYLSFKFVDIDKKHFNFDL